MEAEPDQIIVSPDTLEFVESNEPTVRSLKIANYAALPIAYRIRVSVQHIFVVPNNEDFVTSNEEVEISITMKPLHLYPDVDVSRVKFAIEYAFVSEDDNTETVREFLKLKANSLVRKSVFCHITHKLPDAVLSNQDTMEIPPIPRADSHQNEIEVEGDIHSNDAGQGNNPNNNSFEYENHDVYVNRLEQNMHDEDIHPNRTGVTTENDILESNYNIYEAKKRESPSPSFGGEMDFGQDLNNIAVSTELRNANVNFSLSGRANAIPLDLDHYQENGQERAVSEQDEYPSNQFKSAPFTQPVSNATSSLSVNKQPFQTTNVVSLKKPDVEDSASEVITSRHIDTGAGPRGRVLELMVKNVSRDAPLTPSEVSELKEVRAALTQEMWKDWLLIARKEKYRRQDAAAAALALEEHKAGLLNEDPNTSGVMSSSMLRNDESFVSNTGVVPPHQSLHFAQPQPQPLNHASRRLGSAVSGATNPISGFPSRGGALGVAPTQSKPANVTGLSMTMPPSLSTPSRALSRASSRSGTPIGQRPDASNRPTMEHEQIRTQPTQSIANSTLLHQFTNTSRSMRSSSPFQQRVESVPGMRSPLKTDKPSGAAFGHVTHNPNQMYSAQPPTYSSPKKEITNQFSDYNVTSSDNRRVQSRSESPMSVSSRSRSNYQYSNSSNLNQNLANGITHSKPFSGGSVIPMVFHDSMNKPHDRWPNRREPSQNSHVAADRALPPPPPLPSDEKEYNYNSSNGVSVATSGVPRGSPPKSFQDIRRANEIVRAAAGLHVGTVMNAPRRTEIPSATDVHSDSSGTSIRSTSPSIRRHQPNHSHSPAQPVHHQTSNSNSADNTGASNGLPMSTPAMRLDAPGGFVNSRSNSRPSNRPQLASESETFKSNGNISTSAAAADLRTQLSGTIGNSAEAQSRIALLDSMLKQLEEPQSPGKHAQSPAKSIRTKLQPRSDATLIPDLQPQATPNYFNVSGGNVVATIGNNGQMQVENGHITTETFRGHTVTSAHPQPVSMNYQPVNGQYVNMGNEEDLVMSASVQHAIQTQQYLRGKQSNPHALSRTGWTDNLSTALNALPVDDQRFDNPDRNYMHHVVKYRDEDADMDNISQFSSHTNSNMNADNSFRVDQLNGNPSFASVRNPSPSMSRSSSSYSPARASVRGASNPSQMTSPLQQRYIPVNNNNSARHSQSRVIQPLEEPSHSRRVNGSSKNNMSNDMGAYTFEGVKYDKAQGRMARICLAQGPLVKAFEEFPIRVDAESCYADVVWREYRIPGAQNTQKSQPIHSATGGNASTASTLRRERFTFDDIYAGPSACERLMVYSRLRTRQALLYHKPSLVFLTTVCGEDANIYNRRHRNTIIDSNTIEPPVAIVLGDNGDMGLISVVISEIFTTLPHLQSKETQLANRFERKTISNAMKSKTNAKAHNDIKPNEPYVTMRACVLLENNTIIDLLCSNQDISAQVNRCSVDRQIHNYNQSGNKYPTKSGKYSKTVVVNATQIQLKKISDFDRIIGVIFGRRAAMNEFLARLAQTSDYPSENTTKMYNANGKEVLMHHLAQSPWLVPNDSASLLITITVHNQTKTRSNNVTDFHFVCPCGQQWSTPSPDVCMFVEAISCLPHPPPQYLINSSLLTQILVDPVAQQSSDYVAICSVNRQYSMQSNAQENEGNENYPSNSNQFMRAGSSMIHPTQGKGMGGTFGYNPHELAHMVQSSLQSLRLMAQLAGIY